MMKKLLLSAAVGLTTLSRTTAFQPLVANSLKPISTTTTTTQHLSSSSSLTSPSVDNNIESSGNSMDYVGMSSSVNMEASSSLSSQSSSSQSFDNFDYTSQWYPVIWSQDLQLNRPTQVTLFDTDYVIARIKDKDDNNNNKDDSGKEQDKYRIIAMEDRCPHKSAALSEGRVTSSGNFQCAYHGWTFNGNNGKCIEIPQIVASEGGSAEEAVESVITSRACGTAIPAMIHQGMVWLFPGGNLEKSLLAPPPPSIPEIDMEGYQIIPSIRDFPVDYSILLENIMDPDHGLFAHQAPTFDLYSASKDAPQHLEEEFTNDGKGWTISSKVDAVTKLTAFDKLRRGDQKSSSKKGKNNNKGNNVPLATTTFTAPCHVAIGRRDKDTGSTAFINGFWICPVGTGRSRFMAASVAKMPLKVPRWFTHIFLNNFLDQDTFLLATQQRYVLDKEAKKVQQIIDAGKDPAETKSTNVRKNLYVYRSPTEKLGVRVGAFFDATLNRAPKRIQTLMAADQQQSKPSREVVLDRYNQHTKICPDSQKLLRNCNQIQRRSAIVSLLVIVAKTLALTFATNNSSGLGSIPLFTRINTILKPVYVGWTIGISLFISWLAKKVQREFYFKYDESYRNRDLDKIPKNWLDK